MADRRRRKAEKEKEKGRQIFYFNILLSLIVFLRFLNNDVEPHQHYLLISLFYESIRTHQVVAGFWERDNTAVS